MKTILIVDDDEQIRKIYKQALELEIGQAEILEAGSWQECINGLLLHPGVDLVLLDIRMPDVDGSVVYDIVRLYNPDIRIIVSSVYPSDEQKRLVIRADDYFDKSTGVDRLIEKVRRVVEAAPSRIDRQGGAS